MGQEQKGRKNSLLSPSLEPVKHLSTRLQRKLLKREQRQRKEFRSSGKPYPLVSEQSPIMDMEKNLAASTEADYHMQAIERFSEFFQGAKSPENYEVDIIELPQ